MKHDSPEQSLEQVEQDLQERLFATDELSRRDLRVLIFYLLYAAESFDYQESIETLVDNFNRGYSVDIAPDDEVAQAVKTIVEDRDRLDEIYKPLLTNWRFDRLGTCTKLILRFAIWELEHTDMDPRIIINEAVELAKSFAEKDAYKFINGILDKVIKKMVRLEAGPSGLYLLVLIVNDVHQLPKQVDVLY